MSNKMFNTGVSLRDQVAAMVALLVFKIFQVPIFWSDAKTVVLHWSRQIGKSYVLAAWAVWRILTKAVEGKNWLVCVLSNSKDNGTEFMQKVTQVCQLLGVAFEAEDLSPDDLIDNMRIECRIKIGAFEGRIKVLAANPRTARGFSGDLILDEFAFHLDSYAIWDAAEPILSANAEFQCRIASTGNGTGNMFYQMVAGALTVATEENPAGLSISEAGFIVSRVPRTAAYALGQKIYDLKSGRETTPELAREKALDKSSYDQNYELAFSDKLSQLLSDESISGCEYQPTGAVECIICEGTWSTESLDFLRSCGRLDFGMDVGRTRNISCISVGEKIGGIVFIRAILRLREMRLPAQREQLLRLFELPNMGSGEIDATGLGLGLVEFAQEEMGVYRVRGVNFSSAEQRDERQALIAGNMGLPVDRAPVTELMGLDMLEAFEARAIRIPHEQSLRDSLAKPRKLLRNNRVFIAAEDDAAGHADEFWSVALMLRALGVSVVGIQDIGEVRVGSRVPGVTGRDVRATGARGAGAGFVPRSITDGQEREAVRLSVGVPSTAVQLAINAVQTGNLVRTKREEYLEEVRPALVAYGKQKLKAYDYVGQANTIMEIARLDRLHQVPEEAASA